MDHKCVKLYIMPGRCELWVRDVQVIWIWKAKRTDRTNTTRCERSPASSTTCFCWMKSQPSTALSQFSTGGITRWKWRRTFRWRNVEILRTPGRSKHTSLLIAYSLTWTFSSAITVTITMRHDANKSNIWWHNKQPRHVIWRKTRRPPDQLPRSTQPCIPPGSLNRVPASAGVKAGMSPLPGGR